MRKSRLKILPARCLSKLGFLLLYLACPVIGDVGRDRHPCDGQSLLLQHRSAPDNPKDEDTFDDARRMENTNIYHQCLIEWKCNNLDYIGKYCTQMNTNYTDLMPDQSPNSAVKHEQGITTNSNKMKLGYSNSFIRRKQNVMELSFRRDAIESYKIHNKQSFALVSKSVPSKYREITGAVGQETRKTRNVLFSGNHNLAKASRLHLVSTTRGHKDRRQSVNIAYGRRLSREISVGRKGSESNLGRRSLQTKGVKTDISYRHLRRDTRNIFLENRQFQSLNNRVPTISTRRANIVNDNLRSKRRRTSTFVYRRLTRDHSNSETSQKNREFSLSIYRQKVQRAISSKRTGYANMFRKARLAITGTRRHYDDKIHFQAINIPEEKVSSRIVFKNRLTNRRESVNIFNVPFKRLDSLAFKRQKRQPIKTIEKILISKLNNTACSGSTSQDVAFIRRRCDSNDKRRSYRDNSSNQELAGEIPRTQEQVRKLSSIIASTKGKFHPKQMDTSRAKRHRLHAVLPQIRQMVRRDTLARRNSYQKMSRFASINRRLTNNLSETRTKSNKEFRERRYLADISEANINLRTHSTIRRDSFKSHTRRFIPRKTFLQKIYTRRTSLSVNTIPRETTSLRTSIREYIEKKGLTRESVQMRNTVFMPSYRNMFYSKILSISRSSNTRMFPDSTETRQYHNGGLLSRNYARISHSRKIFSLSTMLTVVPSKIPSSIGKVPLARTFSSTSIGERILLRTTHRNINRKHHQTKSTIRENSLETRYSTDGSERNTRYRIIWVNPAVSNIRLKARTSLLRSGRSPIVSSTRRILETMTNTIQKNSNRRKSVSTRLSNERMSTQGMTHEILPAITNPVATSYSTSATIRFTNSRFFRKTTHSTVLPRDVTRKQKFSGNKSRTVIIPKEGLIEKIFLTMESKSRELILDIPLSKTRYLTITGRTRFNPNISANRKQTSGDDAHITRTTRRNFAGRMLVIKQNINRKMSINRRYSVQNIKKRMITPIKSETEYLNPTKDINFSGWVRKMRTILGNKMTLRFKVASSANRRVVLRKTFNDNALSSHFPHIDWTTRKTKSGEGLVAPLMEKQTHKSRSVTGNSLSLDTNVTTDIAETTTNGTDDVENSCFSFEALLGTNLFSTWLTHLAAILCDIHFVIYPGKFFSFNSNYENFQDIKKNVFQFSITQMKNVFVFGMEDTKIPTLLHNEKAGMNLVDGAVVGSALLLAASVKNK